MPKSLTQGLRIAIIAIVLVAILFGVIVLLSNLFDIMLY